MSRKSLFQTVPLHVLYGNTYELLETYGEHWGKVKGYLSTSWNAYKEGRQKANRLGI